MFPSAWCQRAMAPTQSEEFAYFCGPPWWKCYCGGWYLKRWENKPQWVKKTAEKPGQTWKPGQTEEKPGQTEEKPGQTENKPQWVEKQGEKPGQTEEKPASGNEKEDHYHILSWEPGAAP